MNKHPLKKRAEKKMLIRVDEVTYEHILHLANLKQISPAEFVEDFLEVCTEAGSALTSNLKLIKFVTTPKA